MGSRRATVLNSRTVDSSNGSAATVRRFGVFELDLRAGELRRQGMRIKLQDQPFQVLAQLLEKPGEVVTREELQKRLWPADTFVDFDHSLNAAIRRLRDALGDSAENPTFVETVSRRGYRFLAPVNSGPSLTTNGSGMIDAAPVAADSTPLPTSRLHIWWIVASSGAIILVLLGIKLGLLLAQQHRLAPSRVSQLTANPANDRVRAAAISRDGRYLAFSDETGFYVRQIDTGETHPIALPQDLAAVSLGWFPDSIHLVVALTSQGSPSSLWEISALGGSARKLIDQGRSPAVSPDGKEVAFIAGKKLREQVWLVGVDGAEPRKLVGDEGDLFGTVAWSPSGRKVVYTKARLTYGYGATGLIEIVDLNGQRLGSTRLHVTSVLSHVGLEGPLAWTPDGRLIYSVIEPRPRQSDSNLWSIPLDRESEPIFPSERLTNDPGAVIGISVSGDSKRVVYVKGVPEPDVYVGKLEGSTLLAEPQRLTLDDRQDLPFDWTADSKAVIFMSDRTGTFNIYKQSTNQTVPDVLVGGNRSVASPRLSPDGTQLLYMLYPDWGESASAVPLMRIPVGGGTPEEVLQENGMANQQCARAPATTCIYSVDGQGAFTLFTFDPFQGKGAQVFQIKDDLPQLYNWSLSPDGTTLAIAKGKWGDEEPRIHLVPVDASADRDSADRWLTISGWPGIASLDWAADSKSLWAASVGGDENALLHIDLQGHARPVWRPGKMTVGWAIPSRDGHSLAVLVNSGSANVWMVERP
jgi:Tol biopolymer transport system component/DNA-binding winged helix-turn-helix (wHTH) protein